LKLLILTQYFPPEVGAPQNRLFELAVRLQKLGVEITVLTAMPNYPQMEIYAGYGGKKYSFEEIQGLKVHRSFIYVSKNRSVISRLRNYFSFVWSSARASSRLAKQYDFLFCESPPLFLGYSALYISRKKDARLIFNVSDLWPESAEKLGVINNRFLLKQAYRLEEKLYKRSALVTGQTQGICKNISSRFPDVRTYWLPNGVDLSFYNPDAISKGKWRKKNDYKENDVIFLYAGIIGIAQGLDVILRAAEKLKTRSNIHFALMGAGPEKERLLRLKTELELKNVRFFEAVPKTEMPFILRDVNAAVVPLRKLELFLGAIPSKIFESLAMRLPLVLGVQGEAKALFIDSAGAGIAFEPEDHHELVQAVEKFVNEPELVNLMGDRGRKYVMEKFNREKIAADLLSELKKL
jgi:glycosyltransferase involved in cell wall biosynthesis